MFILYPFTLLYCIDKVVVSRHIHSEINDKHEFERKTLIAISGNVAVLSMQDLICSYAIDGGTSTGNIIIFSSY